MRGDDGAESALVSRGSAETAASVASPRKGPSSRATPHRPPRGGRSAIAAGASATPLGTPRSAAPATRSRTHAAAPPRTEGRSRFGRGGSGGGSEPSSPRGGGSRAASSITSESGAFEDLLSAMDDGGRGVDNVKVVVRVRPANEREQHEAGGRSCVTVVGDRTVVLSDPARPEPFTGTFDYVLGAEASQEDVFRVTGEAVVANCIAGFNSSIFAYGQTGAGKTYTMQGLVERGEDGQLSPSCGLILRVFEALFQRISEEEQERGLDRLRFSVKCSYLEIYNEVITDLLHPTSSGLNIRDGDHKRGVYVEGLSETNVLNADDVVALMTKGSANRKMAETKMNHESSRSHSVFTCTIEAHERTDSGLTNIRYSKLNLIDLAGSERVGKSGATGERLTEAQSINKSLTTLGRVISALVERQKRPATHVPYRDSRLTFLLQESLGGNSKTCIIANVSPSAGSTQETHSTLLFAAGAKKIKNKAVVNEDTEGDMRALQLENMRLARLLEEAQRAQRDAQCAEREAVVAALQDRLQQAEGEVAELQERNARLETVFDQSNAAISQLQAEQAATKKELGDVRGLAARLTEESVRLRSDNKSLSNELAQLRDSYEQEREEGERERGQTRQELESVMAQLLDAEESAHGERREKLAALQEVAQLRKEVEKEREGRRQVLLERDALEDELRRERRDREDARQRAEAALARAQEENAEHFQGLQQLRSEYEALKMQLSEEVVRVAKYRRMAREIGNLVSAVQANSPKAAAGARGSGGGGLLPSPLASLGGRRGRVSLGLSIPAPAEDLPSPLAAASPLNDATNVVGASSLPNRRNSLGRVSIGSAVALRSPAGALSPSKQPKLCVSSPAGRSPLPSPAPVR